MDILNKVTRSIALPNDKRCDAVGNHFLLDATDKMLIQVSRRASESEIAAIVEKALLHGERGGVAVSGCISPGEQAVAKAVREASLPLYFYLLKTSKKIIIIKIIMVKFLYKLDLFEV